MKLIESGHNFLIIDQGNIEEMLMQDKQDVAVPANISCKQIAIILWRLKRFPLIVKVNDSNKNIIYQIINNLTKEKLSFILTGNASKEDFTSLNVFQSVLDMKNIYQYHEVTKEFIFPIQGKRAISLEKLIECNPKFSEIITLKELLLILKGDLHGEPDEQLPVPYIPRRLLTAIIHISTIQQFPGDLFAISGSSDILKKLLIKWKFYTFKDYKESGDSLPRKSIVLCDDEESFATVLKYEKGNVHCFKVINNEHLELTYSKQKNIKLQKYQVVSEEKLHEIVTSNVNLVCARPGMGKLTILNYLKNNCPLDYWPIKVNLQEKQQFYHFNFESDNSFHSKIRQCFREVRRVIFFICGIDNLQETNLNHAIQDIQKLSRDFRVWIFSEDHLKETLEKSFNVTAMHIEEFNEEEQQKYIQERLKGQDVVQGSQKVLSSFKMLKNNNILGAPMHLFMLTEIFINNPQANADEVFLLNNIYQYFIKTKYNHYLSKVSHPCHNQIIEDGIYYRTEQYKLAAISGLDCDYFKNFSLQSDGNFLNQIRRIGDVIGIISKVSDDGDVIFRQETYTDYFASLWLANNFRKVKNMETFIFQEKFKNILFMFNLEICKNNPAHIAVLYQNFEELQKYKNRLNELDILERSLLHLACSCGTKYPKLQTTKYLFKSEATIKEDKEIVNILDYLILNVDFNPLKKDNFFNWNLYDFAFEVFNIYAIERILTTKPETSDTVLDKLYNENNLLSIIYYSVKFGYTNLLELASKTTTFPMALTMENCNGESLLHLAVRCGNGQIATLLLLKGAEVNTTTSTYNKRSPLHLASETGHRDIVALLLQHGALVDVIDRYRNTPLHLASSNEDHHAAEVLLEKGADVNFADNFGRTALHLASTYGHFTIVKLLLEKGAVIDKLDRFGNTPIMCAKDKNHRQIVGFLEKQGARLPQPNFKRRLSANEIIGYTSHQLHCACFIGDVDIIYSLLRDGWNLDEIDNNGFTPLHKAVIGKNLNPIEILLNKGANVNLPDQNKIVPLCRAINNDDYETTTLLLNNNAHMEVKDNFGYTPLHWAYMRGNPDIIKLLLNKNPDLDVIDKFGRKPIDCAVENGHYEAVAHMNNTELLRRAEQISKFSLYFEKIIHNLNDTTNLKPLEEAVNSGISSHVKKCLERENNIDAVDNWGYTALFRAVAKQHKDIVLLLLSKGAKVDASDYCGSTPLHWAVFYGNKEIVDLLIQSKARINTFDAFGYNPLHLAAMNGQDRILSTLIFNGGEYNVIDQSGNTPLDWACKKGHIDCVNVLLKKNAVATSIQGDFFNLAKKQFDFFKTTSKLAVCDSSEFTL